MAGERAQLGEREEARRLGSGGLHLLRVRLHLLGGWLGLGWAAAGSYLLVSRRVRAGWVRGQHRQSSCPSVQPVRLSTVSTVSMAQ